MVGVVGSSPIAPTNFSEGTKGLAESPGPLSLLLAAPKSGRDSRRPLRRTTATPSPICSNCAPRVAIGDDPCSPAAITGAVESLRRSPVHLSQGQRRSVPAGVAQPVRRKRLRGAVRDRRRATVTNFAVRHQLEDDFHWRWNRRDDSSAPPVWTSPSGFMSAPRLGKKCPNMTPNAGARALW